VWWEDEDPLITRQVASALTGIGVDVIRRRVPAVACSVVGRNVLVSRRQAQEALGLPTGSVSSV
jgi:hypothetical protein